MATYEMIKELLDANLKVLTTQIENNRDIMSIKFAELKEDTEEIKQHAKETNGNVASNLDKIRKLESIAAHGKRMWKIRWYYITSIVLAAVVLASVAHEIGLFRFIATFLKATI